MPERMPIRVCGDPLEEFWKELLEKFLKESLEDFLKISLEGFMKKCLEELPKDSMEGLRTKPLWKYCIKFMAVFPRKARRNSWRNNKFLIFWNNFWRNQRKFSVILKDLFFLKVSFKDFLNETLVGFSKISIKKNLKK